MLAAIGAQKGKAILAAVLLVLAGGWLWYQSRDANALPSRLTLVCVATGKTFTLDRSKVGMLPARNPETGEHTLLICHQRDGKWYVTDRARQTLESLAGVNRWVDPQSLEVRPPP